MSDDLWEEKVISTEWTVEDMIRDIEEMIKYEIENFGKALYRHPLSKAEQELIKRNYKKKVSYDKTRS